MGLNNAKFMSGGRRLTDYEGSHAIEILSVTEGLTARSRQTKTTIEVKIHNSDHPDFKSEIDEGKTVSAEVTFLLGDYPDYYYTDLRNFLGAVLGEDPADEDFDWDEAFKNACEKDTANGELLMVEVYDTGKKYSRGKRAGKPVLNARWESAGV